MTGVCQATVAVCVLLCCFMSVSSELVTINGELLQIVNNCTVGDDSTCANGQCCVKEGLAYIPEFTGPKPTYQIACKPYRQAGEFCYKGSSHEFCPCDPTLHCNSNGLFGHCVVV